MIKAITSLRLFLFIIFCGFTLHTQAFIEHVIPYVGKKVAEKITDYFAKEGGKSLAQKGAELALRHKEKIAAAAVINYFSPSSPSKTNLPLQTRKISPTASAPSEKPVMPEPGNKQPSAEALALGIAATLATASNTSLLPSMPSATLQLEKKAQEKKVTTPAEETELGLRTLKETEEDRRKKQYALTCALLHSDRMPSVADTIPTFDLPGKKIPLSQIPLVKGRVVTQGDILQVYDVELPGYGPASFEIQLKTPSIYHGPHKDQKELLIYPPIPSGEMVRVNVPSYGERAQLVIFIPHHVLDYAQAVSDSFAKLAVQRLALHGSALDTHHILAKAHVDEHGNIHIDASDLEKEGIATTARLAFRAGIPLLTISGAGATVGAGIAVPIIIGGVAVYGIFKGFTLGINWVRNKRAMNRMVALLPPENATKEKGCVPTPVPEKQKPGCRDNSPLSVEKPTGCGDTSKPSKGETHIFPESQEKPILIHTLSEIEVKKKYGEILKGLCEGKNLEIDQVHSEHVKSGHLEEGTRVYENPNKPKTLFLDEAEMIRLMVETIDNVTKKKNGTKIIQGDDICYEFDFGHNIGKTVDGKPLTKVRVIVRYIQQTDSYQFITMYPLN